MKKLIAKYKSLSVVAKASLWFLICNVLQRGLSIITTPVFTRLLTTEEYGIINSYSAWMAIFVVITSFKLNYGVYNKGMSKFKESKDDYNASMQSTTSILTIAFAVVYFLFVDYFNEITGLQTVVMICMIVHMFFEPVIGFWSLRERYDFRYKKVVLVTIAMSILCPLTSALSIVFWKDSAANVKIISNVVVVSIFGIAIFIYNFRRSKKIFDLKYVKFALLFNLPLIPHYFSEYILDQSDRIMIQKMCSQTALGLYSVAYNAGMTLKILVTSINSAILPWMYRQLEKKEFDKIHKMIMKVLLFLSISLCMFILIAPEIVRILATPQYMEAIYVIPPVTVTVIFIFLFGIYGNIEFYYDKNMFTMNVSIGASILNIVLNLVLIPSFGYVAAAYTTLVGYIILCVSHAIFVEKISIKKNKRKIFDEKHIWILIAYCILFGIMSSFLYKYTLIRYVGFAIVILLMIIKHDEIINLVKQIKS